MREKSTSNDHNLAVSSVSLLVAAYGIYVIAETLFEVLLHHQNHFGRELTDINVDVSLLLGVSVIYLSSLLRRRKRTAWTVTVVAYITYIVIGFTQILRGHERLVLMRHPLLPLFRVFLFPAVILILLYVYRHQYVVKSDIKSFSTSVRFVVIIIFVTIVYGISGFLLMDTSDFHQEINFGEALHYTVDQFNITTTKPVVAHTKRAKLFLDSLSFVSIISVIYAGLSLFQPLKIRFADQSQARDHLEVLLNRYGGEAEEFFKLWPKDKQYFFNEVGDCALAFHVYHGIALCLGDPIGNPEHYDNLLHEFINQCFSNDWLPSFIHTSDKHIKLYKKHGFTVQKLGQEAVVETEKFVNELKGSKYFRQILNRFSKQDYSYELLSPPHHQAVLARTKTISDEWLSGGNKSERGFTMGYYTHDYMQLCDLMVARDAAGTIQAFINVIPAEWNKEEATYDMVRQSSAALGNVVDYLLINLIAEMHAKGYKYFNLGLSPLAGLDDESSEKRTLVDNLMKFAYANGDPFFSFSGLYKFKSKYEPDWQDRFVVYKNGLTGFSKTMTTLTRYMSKSVNLPKSK
ncbi:MAG TPA: phosphatidylglycerol lysyltransferase domain-containing protein [Candidatus Saccharimonadales bacterium]|nr:phosphatidylglycerol lysyltransferase domain-containing protein [Candidatus Saccharimonadales bacterium]